MSRYQEFRMKGHGPTLFDEQELRRI